MHAFLFINPTQADVLNKANEVAPNSRIIHYKLEKIADTRELIRQTNMALSTPTVYILDNFDTASVEAQNAFLKRLEEPAANLCFFLVAESQNRVLPTIMSRCQVIRFENKLNKFKDLSEFTKASIGEKFRVISKITKREDAIDFLKNLIINMYQSMPETGEKIKVADETLLRISQNANPTLQLTHMVVSLQ